MCSDVDPFEGHFEGIVEGGRRPEILQKAWIEENVAEGTVRHLVSQASYGKLGFFPLPPGAAKDHGEEANVAVDELSGSHPVIVYRQKEGEPTCTLASVCNCLVHWKCNRQAAICWDLMKAKLTDTHDRWQVLITGLTKVLRNYRIIKAPKGWDPLKYRGKNPAFFALVGSDGKTDHAVTVSDGWIFDGNFSHALPLTKENLDKCCSTENDPQTYMKVGKKAYIMQEHENTKPLFV